MKKSVRIIVLASIAAMVLTMVLGCGGNRNRFVGTWVEIDESGNPTGEKMVLAKNGEGSVTDSGLAGTLKWSVDGDRVFLTLSMCGVSETKECRYEFAGDRLILTPLDGSSVGIYQKQ